VHKNPCFIAPANPLRLRRILPKTSEHLQIAADPRKHFTSTDDQVIFGSLIGRKIFSVRCKFRKIQRYLAMFRIRFHRFQIQIRIHHFRLNINPDTDPDTDPDPGF
jgi:hypothetical protein